MLVNNQTVSLPYADDIIIIANSRDDLQSALEERNQKLEEQGMRISKTKTETMCISKTSTDLNITIGGENINQTTSFKYMELCLVKKITLS